MSIKPSRIVISAMKRNQRARGPTSSEQQNDFQNEVIRDLSVIQQEWNNKIVPLMNSLPDGSLDSSVDAFNNGLDGSTLFVSKTATVALSAGKFYNTTAARPNTVFEQLVNLYTHIDDAVEALATEIEGNGSGITSDQKAAIGSNIFDPFTNSAADSLDGIQTIHTGNILQIARDVYGEANPTLNSNGDAQLTLSVKDMMEALLALHGGAWDADISLTHSGISASDLVTGTLKQDRVGTSSSSVTGQSDSFSGSPSNLAEDLNRIRTLIKEIKGGTSFTQAISAPGTWSPVAAPPVTFSGLLNLKGSEARTDTNPWGLGLLDIPTVDTAVNNLDARLDLVENDIDVIFASGSAVPSGIPEAVIHRNSLDELVVDPTFTYDGTNLKAYKVAFGNGGPALREDFSVGVSVGNTYFSVTTDEVGSGAGVIVKGNNGENWIELGAEYDGAATIGLAPQSTGFQPWAELRVTGPISAADLRITGKPNSSIVFNEGGINTDIRFEGLTDEQLLVLDADALSNQGAIGVGVPSGMISAKLHLDNNGFSDILKLDINGVNHWTYDGNGDLIIEEDRDIIPSVDNEGGLGLAAKRLRELHVVESYSGIPVWDVTGVTASGVASDSGSLITNFTVSGSFEFLLPVGAEIGTNFEFLSSPLNGATLYINPVVGDIYIGTTTYSNTRIYISGGAGLKLILAATGKWVALQYLNGNAAHDV